MWKKLFRSKEQTLVDQIVEEKEKKEKKQHKLKKELEEFTSKNKDYFNTFCFNGKNVVIYKKPEIFDGVIVLNYIDIKTPTKHTSYLSVDIFNSHYGVDFMRNHRTNFITIKSDMEKLGLEIKKYE